jgi:LysM repeat protein
LSSDSATYVVRYGDTVSGIASRYGTTTRTILALNPLIDPYSLQPGESILLPASAGVLTPRRSIDTTRVATRATAVAPASQTPVVININGQGHVSQPDAAVAINMGQNAVPTQTVSRVVTTPIIERTVTMPVAQHTTGQPSVHYETIGTVPSARTTNPTYQAASSGHVSAAPTQGRAGLRYQASLPRDGRAYNDLGTACMRINATGEQEVYRVNSAMGGPDCGRDKPVRLYKASN